MEIIAQVIEGNKENGFAQMYVMYDEENNPRKVLFVDANVAKSGKQPDGIVGAMKITGKKIEDIKGKLRTRFNNHPTPKGKEPNWRDLLMGLLSDLNMNGKTNQHKHRDACKDTALQILSGSHTGLNFTKVSNMYAEHGGVQHNRPDAEESIMYDVANQMMKLTDKYIRVTEKYVIVIVDPAKITIN